MSDAVHGTCVAWQGRGVLLLGASGSGKSSLAIALCENGWMLVADDAVVLDRAGQATWARPLAGGRGWLGLGGQNGDALRTVRMPYREPVQLALVAKLDRSGGAPLLFLPVVHLPEGYKARENALFQGLIECSAALG